MKLLVATTVQLQDDRGVTLAAVSQTVDSPLPTAGSIDGIEDAVDSILTRAHNTIGRSAVVAFTDQQEAHRA